MTWIPSIQIGAPQGWECPKCGRVYAPSTVMCLLCPGRVVQVINTTDIVIPPVAAPPEEET